MVDIEDLILGENVDENIDDKWNLLLWSLGMDEQLRFDLETMPGKEKYIHTVLALKFLFKVYFVLWFEWDIFSILSCSSKF